MTEVVAALIWREGRFFICQRPENKARGGLWEFVGGKVEASERHEDALVRECAEELAVCVSVGDVFMDVTHVYPDITVHLTVFCAEIIEGVPQQIEHQAFAWICPSEIERYNFCPADVAILEKLKQRR